MEAPTYGALVDMKRFIMGLGKKALIANTMGSVADKVFEQSVTCFDTATWIGACAYSMQLYFDFSGYSDMAIGLGTIFGFKFQENFNYLYISRSVTEFWRRWHISLSTWFKQYVYIPLGGNRVTTRRMYLNLSLLHDAPEVFKQLGRTLRDWCLPIIRMWRFTRNNGITEGLHRRMKLIQRRAYGYRNFQNYKLRVLVECGGY